MSGNVTKGLYCWVLLSVESPEVPKSLPYPLLFLLLSPSHPCAADIWGQHPRLIFIPVEFSLYPKATSGSL